MARASTVTTGLASVLLTAGLVVAYAQRDSDPAAAAVSVLAGGTVLAVAAAATGVRESQHPPGLQRPPDEADSWPVWSWWWVIGAAGAIDVLAGPLVSGWLGVVGALLLGVAAIGLGRDLLAPAPSVDRGTVRAALRLRSAGGGHASAAVTRVGSIGARVVVFDESHRLADVVVRDQATGERAARLAGLDLVAPGDLHPPLRTG